MPISSPTYQCGDVVVVPFPFSDKLAGKRRPALVVSSAGVAADGLVWLVMITSAKHSAGAFDCAISDLQKAGLTKPCLVRPTKITALEPSRILRFSGRLAAAETNRALATVRSLVGADLPLSQRAETE